MADMIIDAHLHVFSDDLKKYPYHTQTPYIPDFPATAEDFGDLMRENGVSRAVLVQPSAYMYDHRYLTEVLKRYPGKFAGVCLVDPLAKDAPEQLEALVAQGYKGLRINPLARGDEWLDDPATYPLWEAADRLGVIISALILPQQLGKLETMVNRFPDVTVVIDHMGRAKGSDGFPYPSFQPVLQLSEYPNTYLKVSGIPVSSSQPYPYPDVLPMVEMAVEAYSPQRLMWATDYPWIMKQCGYRKCLDLVYKQMTYLSDSERAYLLGGTCKRLFFKDAE